MREASSRLEFERAAHLRDQIAALKAGRPTATQSPAKKTTYPKGPRRKK
jgi:excinuclease UvrABC nuclease subunit